MEGPLVHVDGNVFGCQNYSSRLDGAIVLVQRGTCWFHNKALNAEAAGAAGVIVYNDQRRMIDIMGGVDELPSPSISTILIEEDVEKMLLRHLGSHIIVTKADL